VSFPERVTDVVDPSQLSSVTGALRGAREVAVDVEADSMHHFRARLCFVQLGTDADVFLLDTLVPGVSPQALADTFADPGVTKFFHASQGDLQYLAEAGVRVRGLFDTHRAATLLGWPKVGLADLVRERLGRELKKEHQQADFSVRPLPAELREYISDDVRYLCEVGRWVREACVAADVLEEVQLDCDRLCDDAAARPDPLADYQPKLNRQGLGREGFALAWHLAHALHCRRLAWAEAMDLPMGRVLSNMALSAIATRPPTSLKELSRLEGVRGAFVRERGEEVLALVASLSAAVKTGELGPPEEKRERDPGKKRREEALLAWRKAEAAERKVTPSVVLSNGLVQDLASLAPDSLEALAKVPYFGARRLERYGRALVELLTPLR
jgi:ribonuclease D